MDPLKQALDDFARSHQAILQNLRCQQSSQKRRYYRHRPPPWRNPTYPIPPKSVPYYKPLTAGLLPPGAWRLREKVAAYQAVEEGLTTPITPNETHVVVDMGASISITNEKDDFISEISPVQSTELQGIASGLQIEGNGTVCYSFQTDDGDFQSITMHNVSYVPKCNVWLLCPRHLAATTNHAADGFNSLKDNGILTCFRKQTTIPYHSGTSLPILTKAPGLHDFNAFCVDTGLLNDPSCFSSISVLSPAN